jgi:hypothetical protein
MQVYKQMNHLEARDQIAISKRTVGGVPTGAHGERLMENLCDCIFTMQNAEDLSAYKFDVLPSSLRRYLTRMNAGALYHWWNEALRSEIAARRENDDAAE